MPMNITNYASLSSARSPNYANLDQEIAAQAVAILNKNKYVLNKGRKNILNLITREPEQLGKDLGRVSGITIGTHTINKHVYVNKAPNWQYKYISEQLETYMKTSASGHVGSFCTLEVIYALVQSFQAPAQARAYKNIASIKNNQWACEIGSNAKNYVSFKYVAPNVLVVSNICEKYMLDMSNNINKKIFITQADIIYDLKSGEVKFNYSYDFDNNYKNWTDYTFEA